MEIIRMTKDQTQRLQRFVEKHLDNCLESLDMDDCSFVTEEGEIFEPYGVFCGCSTCLTREQIMATIDFFEKENLFRLESVDEDEE